MNSNINNAVLLYRSLLYCVFHFLFPYYSIWFGACVVHAQPYLHPCGYLTHTHTQRTCNEWIDTHSHTTDNMQQTRYTPHEYCLQVSCHKSSVLFTTLTSQLKTNTRQCCSPSDHTTHCVALYITHCSYDTHNATVLGDVTVGGPGIRNNLRLRYSSGEEKIEDRDRNRDLGDLD